jgi:hypothetical protein
MGSILLSRSGRLQSGFVDGSSSGDLAVPAFDAVINIMEARNILMLIAELVRAHTRHDRVNGLLRKARTVFPQSVFESHLEISSLARIASRSSSST